MPEQGPNEWAAPGAPGDAASFDPGWAAPSGPAVPPPVAPGAMPNPYGVPTAPYGAPNQGYGAAPNPYVAQPPMAAPRVRQRSFAQANIQSLVALGVAAVYLVLNLELHLVMLGVIPAMAAYRAIQRREPLAPIAMVFAVAVIAFGFMSMA